MGGRAYPSRPHGLPFIQDDRARICFRHLCRGPARREAGCRL